MKGDNRGKESRVEEERRRGDEDRRKEKKMEKGEKGEHCSLHLKIFIFKFKIVFQNFCKKAFKSFFSLSTQCLGGSFVLRVLQLVLARSIGE